MAIYNKEYTDTLLLNESGDMVFCGSIIGAFAVALAIKAIKELKAHKNYQREEAMRKELTAFIEKTPEMKATKDGLYDFGESVGNAVAKHLREYARKEGYSSNKNFNANDIKYDPINGFDVQVSDFQSGISDEVIDEWERKNPGKDWSKDSTVNNDYYYGLLDEGEKCVKDIFNKLNKENNYELDGVDTGDGDEAHIYIDIVFSSKYKAELDTIIDEKYKEEIKRITDKYKK